MNPEMICEVQTRTNYGQTYYYPKNENARNFARLIDKYVSADHVERVADGDLHLRSHIVGDDQPERSRESRRVAACAREGDQSHAWRRTDRCIGGPRGANGTLRRDPRQNRVGTDRGPATGERQVQLADLIRLQAKQRGAGFSVAGVSVSTTHRTVSR